MQRIYRWLLLTALGGLMLAGAPLGRAVSLTYGIHEPQGKAAVDYIYSSSGTWRQMSPINYTYNYYSQWATANHPYNFTQLLVEASTYNRTCRDANGYLLLDYNHDNEIDTTSAGYAFHEHNAKGAGGVTIGSPFYNFWFDDNWLARFMAIAYERTQPNGLWEPGAYVRWRPVDGSTYQWTPYNSSARDRLALDGMYYMGANNISTAVSKWNSLKTACSPVWDSSNQRYDYNVPENYHLGLFGMLSAHLMSNSSVTASKRTEILQHYMSIRSLLIARQETSGGAYLAWRSDVTNSNSLMNTESASCGSLALSADARRCYEAGLAPMYYDSTKSFYVRPYTALSAVTGLSSQGYMAYGPYRPLPATGSYQVQFMVRSPSPTGTMCYIDVYNASTGQVLASQSVASSAFNASNQWTPLTLSFTCSTTSHNMEYRVWWYGTASMDLAAIRVR